MIRMMKMIIMIVALKKTILPARCVFLAPLAAAAAVNPTRKQSQKTSYNLKHQDHDDDGDDFLQGKVNCVCGSLFDSHSKKEKAGFRGKNWEILLVDRPTVAVKIFL